MANRKTFSEEMKRWYCMDMRAILIELKDGKQVYTNHFEFTFADGRKRHNFVGKTNRPYLLKCLWTLEADGLIENINLGFKTYQWKITDKGKEQDPNDI